MERKNNVGQSAIKTIIRELWEGTYIQEDERTPNYLLTKNDQKIYGINIMATVLSKDKVGSITNLLIDDGTGQITVRTFEESEAISNLQPGDVILVLGKLRMYNQEKYISPDVLRKVPPLWLKVRALELKLKSVGPGETKKQVSEAILENSKRDIREKQDTEIHEGEGKDSLIILPIQKVVKIIKDLDKGEGVLMEDVIENSPLQETDKLLHTMLERGDIFQIAPGKVKVL